jgi:hypothetical protein
VVERRQVAAITRRRARRAAVSLLAFRRPV